MTKTPPRYVNAGFERNLLVCEVPYPLTAREAERLQRHLATIAERCIIVQQGCKIYWVPVNPDREAKPR